MTYNTLVYIFLKLLSYSPFFRISDDCKFGEFNKESMGRERLSVFSINLGKIIIHIFTGRIDQQKDEFFKIINLDNLINSTDDKKNIFKKYKKYKNEIRDLKTEKILIHKEHLMYKINQIENSKNLTFNKHLAYLAIVALLLPLYSVEFSYFEKPMDYFIILLLIVLFSILINLLVFFYSFMKVRGYSRSTFKDFRTSHTPLSQFTLSLYYEWQNLNNEKAYQVTLMKNIEKYMVRFIIITILLFIVRILN